MKLKSLYEDARREDELAVTCYRTANWDSFRVCIARRNALIDAIFLHPKNLYTRLAIMCRVISGLSGKEEELKAA
jgi:hypothetical protein